MSRQKPRITLNPFWPGNAFQRSLPGFSFGLGIAPCATVSEVLVLAARGMSALYRILPAHRDQRPMTLHAAPGCGPDLQKEWNVQLQCGYGISPGDDGLL